MEKITITLETVNSAFEGEDKIHEMARILEEVASLYKQGHYPKTMRDLNGNKVGTITYD